MKYLIVFLGLDKRTKSLPSAVFRFFVLRLVDLHTALSNPLAIRHMWRMDI